MSDLEDETKPILTPMMFADSAAIELTVAAQQTLSTWAMKTMLMAAFLASDHTAHVPLWFYSRFYRERKPPDNNAVIWTAAYNGPSPQLSSTAGSVDVRATHGYNVDGILVPGETVNKAAHGTLRVLFAIFQVFVYPGYGVPMGHRSDGQVLHRIWPKRDTSLWWPASGVAIDDESYERLAGRMGEIELL